MSFWLMMPISLVHIEIWGGLYTVIIMFSQKLQGQTKYWKLIDTPIVSFLLIALLFQTQQNKKVFDTIL